MMHVTIDDAAVKDGCVVCCCETVSLKPGETQPLRLNYAPWALPIAGKGLHCEPTIEIEEKDTCPPAMGGNLPPASAEDIRFDVPPGVPFSGDLATQVIDPEDDTMAFKTLALSGPKHGKLVLNTDGSFVYTPVVGYVGPDNFFFTVNDGVNSVTLEALLGVGIPGDDVSGTWNLTVGKPTVDQRYYVVTVPITASPAAKTCQIFRLTIRQGALSCDCECYYHVDCVDVRIVKC
jgi:hypothetical protein